MRNRRNIYIHYVTLEQLTSLIFVIQVGWYLEFLNEFCFNLRVESHFGSSSSIYIAKGIDSEVEVLPGPFSGFVVDGVVFTEAKERWREARPETECQAWQELCARRKTD